MGRTTRRISAREIRMANKEEAEREKLMVKANNMLSEHFLKEVTEEKD
jgi:hypothetical protein